MNFFYFFQYLKGSYADLQSTKLRSLLAILGVSVGVASIIALMASGKMASEKMLSELNQLGTHLVEIHFYDDAKNHSKNSAVLNLNDLSQLKSQVKGLISIAPMGQSFWKAHFQEQSFETNVISTTEDLLPLLKLKMRSGHFIHRLEGDTQVCVLGAGIFENLLKQNKENPLGKTLHIANRIFLIEGIAKPWEGNAFFNFDLNQAIFIPIGAHKKLGIEKPIQSLILDFHSDSDLKNLLSSIHLFFETRFSDLRLFIRSPKELIANKQNQASTLDRLLVSIAGIALFVGGIGIMNILLVLVIERRREIGLRLALGAKKQDIWALFLTYSILLSFIGGVFGIILGEFIAFCIAFFVKWTFHFYFSPIFIGLSLAIFTGLIFGYFPARKAAGSLPIHALRDHLF